MKEQLIEENKATRPQLSKENVWNKIVSYIKRGNINEAYEFALSKKDNDTLMTLMMRTGAVVKKLEVGVLENLVRKIAELIYSGEFSDVLLKWVRAVIDVKEKVSIKGKVALVNAMNDLCEDDERREQLTEIQLNEANTILNMLKMEID